MVGVVACAAPFLLPSIAHAFCRTTTSSVPAGYDPVEHGCWTQGTPLAWHTSRAPYGVSAAASDQVSLADATRIADLSFAAWNDAACTGGHPYIQAYDEGPILSIPDAGDCSTSAMCDPQTHDVIVFDDVTWPHDDPASVLALTTVTYGVDDGTIFEAYTEVNATPGHEITTQEPPPVGSPAHDLQSILTHEAGHFFGLAHATEASSVMYAYYAAGKVTLTADDISGFCTVYPASGPTQGPSSGGSSGGSCASVSGGAGGPASVAGIAFAVAMGWRIRRRRR